MSAPGGVMHGLGRLHLPDERDYPLAAVTAASGRTWRYWWPSGWWGDQGNTPQCVAYALLHQLADGPRTHPDFGSRITPRQLYCAAQELDPWDGDCDNPQYDGTSVRAGVKVLRRLDLIGEYRWAWDLDTTVNAVLETGPVVAGTNWTEGMFTPDGEGYVYPTGATAGGHAYKIDGVNRDRRVLRIKNSWGRGWGRNGFAWITFDAFAELLAAHGEVCHVKVG